MVYQTLCEVTLNQKDHESVNYQKIIKVVVDRDNIHSTNSRKHKSHFHLEGGALERLILLERLKNKLISELKNKK